MKPEAKNHCKIIERVIAPGSAARKVGETLPLLSGFAASSRYDVTELTLKALA
jgi:hypothetical protein